MKIGVFDSGLGGLKLLHSIREELPGYDYVFYGDTLHVPYGEKSTHEIYELTKKGIEYLFNHGCIFILLGCNTASAKVLPMIQDTLPTIARDPCARVLGIIVPTVEKILQYKNITILATRATSEAHGFDKAFARYGFTGEISYKAAPTLVPFIENGLYDQAVEDVKNKYLNALPKKTDAVVLGCTHYMLLKDEIHKILPKNINLISQDEIIPLKCRQYLENHPEIDQKLSKEKSIEVYVTKETSEIQKLSKEWFNCIPKLVQEI